MNFRSQAYSIDSVMEKLLTALALLLLPFCGCAQKIDFNQENGFVANGYDVVSYFSGTPKKGDDKFTYTFEGGKFRFSSESNVKKFRDHPEKYVPQYGGWCAYALGANNSKVSIDPETYEIRNGKLYLFYNRFFNNTHTSWIKEGADQLIKQGDKNWVNLKYKKN